MLGVTAERLAQPVARPDATVISIGHRPELAAFHQRKIVFERSRKGAKLVDGAAGGAAAPGWLPENGHSWAIYEHAP
jgi:ABC-type uncharacterized transport system fused permease/ATPase subunit